MVGICLYVMNWCEQIKAFASALLTSERNVPVGPYTAILS